MNKINEKFPPRAQRKLTAGLSGMLACLLMILVFEEDRGAGLYAFFITPLSSLQEIGALISYITPMIFVALATALVFQCRRYSLTMMGSFMLSASLVTGFLLRGDEQPGWYLIPCALIISVLVGAAAAAIPALLSVRRRVNITLSSLVLDFLILQLTSFMLSNYMSDPRSGQNVSFAIPERLWLPEFLPVAGLRLGTLIAAAAVTVLYLLLYRGRLGYEIRAVGASESMAGYVGLSYGKTVLVVQLLAGALAGLGGAVEMMGIQTRYVWDGSFPTVVFLGILAAVIAGYHPLWIPVGCLFFGYLWRGGVALNAQSGFPIEVALFAAAITVLVLFALRDAEVFSRVNQFFRKLMPASAAKTDANIAAGSEMQTSEPLKAPRVPRRKNTEKKQKEEKDEVPQQNEKEETGGQGEVE